jgi:hypothetical protein
MLTSLSWESSSSIANSASSSSREVVNSGFNSAQAIFLSAPFSMVKKPYLSIRSDSVDRQIIMLVSAISSLR